MSTSSYTLTTTFTLTHARHMAAKVATDLRRLQRFYDYPSDADISKYEIEVAELLKAGYLDTIKYGFRRNGEFIEPTLCYTASDLSGSSTIDNDPGRVKLGANIEGATFYSYLTPTMEWYLLSPAEREAFEERLPFRRSGAPEPGINGYLVNDLIYSAGGKALQRASVRSY
jgi:hypothetical protein